MFMLIDLSFNFEKTRIFLSFFLTLVFRRRRQYGMDLKQKGCLA
ncbi:hypothetical protein [Polaromonas sp. YR568]